MIDLEIAFRNKRIAQELVNPKSPRVDPRQLLKFEKLFTQLYISNTDIHQYFREEDLPKLTRKEKIAPNIDEQVELQTALEDHFSK